ncbi:MAG: M28 family peptidase, partial [Crocinitomicaceae bacterium]
GAARRWAFQKFSSFSAQAENRLIPSYFQFDKTICNVTQHRNVIGVLPGTDTSNHEVIIIEGHMDSRCENECDITCQAQGIEDNASGSALVFELARVMSKCSYKNTLVFMLTIGEEQGLYGADAFA